MRAGSAVDNRACRGRAEIIRPATGRPVLFAAIFSVALTLGLTPQVALAKDGEPSDSAYAKRANFESEHPSAAARQVADWVVDSNDHQGLPFAVIDKVAARVFIFHPDGKLRGAGAALLGIAKGDDSVPGIGELPLSAMPPQVRTTPAGRFVASMGMNASGKDVLWVDYDAAVSMHRVINTKPEERRPHRLATPTPLDNRISFGCINVPIKFFDDVVSPAFKGTNGIVYILPEVKRLRDVFTAVYDVDERARIRMATQPESGSSISATGDLRDSPTLKASPADARPVAVKVSALPARPAGQ